MEPTQAFEGIGVAQARNKSCMTSLYRSRRFFPPGAAAEIWAEFAPTLLDVSSPDAFEALGWVSILMPTQAAARRDGEWGQWAVEWMSLWSSVTHIHYWQALWMGLFARLIRHDVHGLVNWAAMIPELANRFLWAFNLPVGTATASPPFSGAAPGMCVALFDEYVGSRSGAAAHSLIYLLGRCAEGTAASDDSALTAFESTVALLEQYYHPSNGGKWTSGLAVFLRESSAHLCQRLVTENGRGNSSNAAAATATAAAAAAALKEGRHAAANTSSVAGVEDAMDDSDDEDDESDEEEEDEEEEEEASIDSGYCEDEDSDEDIVSSLYHPGCDTGSTTGGVLPNARRHLTQETTRRVAAALVRLASKGQSSKEGHMKRYSSVVLSQLAYVVPDLVLPFIHHHFITALETVTAARQYGNAIQTLSLCVRPLLLAGLSSSASPSAFSAPFFTTTTTTTNGTMNGTAGDVEMEESIAMMRGTAAQSVASALMRTLPGIDANDPPKSLAVFRLYCCVLSCAGELPVSLFIIF